MITKHSIILATHREFLMQNSEDAAAKRVSKYSALDAIMRWSEDNPAKGPVWKFAVRVEISERTDADFDWSGPGSATLDRWAIEQHTAKFTYWIDIYCQ